MSNPGPPPTPAQPLAPGNYDRAWNDPPLFSYSTSSGPQAGSTRQQLTKRVGFPASQPPPPGQDPTAPPKLHDAGAKPPSSGLPPPPPSTILFHPPPVAPSGDDSTAPTHAQPSVTVDATVTVFTELTKSYLEPRKCEDINKRLAVMFTAWREGKLNPRIQALVAEVGHKLSIKDVSGAEASFVVLSADYGGEVGAQWVLAVRHVISAAKGKISENVVEEGVTKPL